MIIPTYLSGWKIAVFGLGKAGIATIDALHRAGAEIYSWDDGQPARTNLENKKLSGVKIIEPANFPWHEIKFLALSPGIAFTHPKPHTVVDMAHNVSCPVICDIEILYQANSQAKFLGITGTNGKSTTTALLGHILQNSGKKAQIGGNIGIPVLNLEPLEADGIYVLEMSSYQLDLIKQTHFNVSILLNITPDHLDRHGDMAGYIAAKCRIFSAQNQNDTAIIGIDDIHCQKIYENLQYIGNVIPISTKQIINGGIAVIDGIIHDATNPGEVKTYNLGYLERLPGSHNGQNIAAAFAASTAFGVAPLDIIAAIKSFAGLKHRIELVCQIAGVKFINDSKATNADACANALRAFNNIYWIAGGLAKEGGIASLQEFFPKIRHAFLMGAAQDNFAKELEGKVPYTKCNDLATAFTHSQQLALQEKIDNAVILLSPACASWDQWPNFEVRGEAFCQMALKAQNKTTVTT